MRRPGNIAGNHWFGDFKEKPKKVLHPDIYAYSSKHISPGIRKGVKEVAEQIYTFDLFTPEFCKKLIAEAEFQGGWSTGIDKAGFSGFGVLEDLFKSNKKENEKDTTLSLEDFPSKGSLSLSNTINQTSKRIVRPFVEKLWKSFAISRYDQPYLLKYDPKVVNKMNLHNDQETVALVVYLNTGYEGGGTYFPRWKLKMQPEKAGQEAMWPGGVSHEHIGLPITGGLRYLLCCAYY